MIGAGAAAVATAANAQTDHGTLPNLRFSYADSHVRQESGGWARQVTVRELGVSTDIAGVNMRLNSNCLREMHWHKQAEWAYMLTGLARINAIDASGNVFVDDVGVGDLWYFPAGIPHAIQGLGSDGCEFLLVFDDGNFDEDSTFLLSDWFKHVPLPVPGKNFGVDGNEFKNTPSPSEEYMFPGTNPGPLGADRYMGRKPVLNSFSYKMMTQTPIKTKSGSVRIVDSSQFKASKTIAAAMVEIEPGGMRELHWHPNTNEWQYYLAGEARMGVFAGSGQAMSGMSPSAWSITSRTSARLRCAFSKCSSPTTMPTSRSTSGWRSPRASRSRITCIWPTTCLMRCARTRCRLCRPDRKKIPTRCSCRDPSP